MTLRAAGRCLETISCTAATLIWQDLVLFQEYLLDAGLTGCAELVRLPEIGSAGGVEVLQVEAGIARGFSRDTQMPMLLPYVAPTTDWIRLQRRIPVTIVLDGQPPGGRLYMGADARTVIFP